MMCLYHLNSHNHGCKWEANVETEAQRHCELSLSHALREQRVAEGQTAGTEEGVTGSTRCTFRTYRCATGDPRLDEGRTMAGWMIWFWEFHQPQEDVGFQGCLPGEREARTPHLC